MSVLGLKSGYMGRDCPRAIPRVQAIFYRIPPLILIRKQDSIKENGVNISLLLNSFQIGYDRRVRQNYGGIPVTVGVSFYILSIGDLSEKSMDFTSDMYLRQFWKLY